MSAVADLMTEYDYSSRDLEDDRLDRGPMPADPDRKWGRRADREFADHHIRLIRAMEPAKWPKARQGFKHLSDEDVLSIRQRYAAGDVTFLTLAEEYNMCQEAVGEIVRGNTYTRLGGPISRDNLRRGERHADAKLTEQDVVDIRRKYAAGGYSYASLAQEYGRGESTIAAIISGRSWTHVA